MLANADRKPLDSFPFVIGERRFLLSDIQDSIYFTIVDDSARVLRRRTYPLGGADSVPWIQRRDATNGAAVCVRRDGRGFAVNYPNAGRIELRDENAELQGLVKVPFASEERFLRDESDGALKFSRDRYYYRDCAFSRTMLFALFSGNPGANANIAVEAHFLHVFDLDGNLVKIFVLDRDVIALAVDADGRTLFGNSMRDGAVYSARLCWARSCGGE